jgi:hypothetical protein
VTLQAPIHKHWFGFVGERHLVNPPVASFATHAVAHVNTVIKKDKIREIVQAVPSEGFSGSIAGASRLQNFGIGIKLGMTGHTSVSGGNSGKGRVFHRGVAVATLDAYFANVVLVAERDGLFGSKANIRHKRRTHKKVPARGQNSYKQCTANNRNPGNGIHTGMENLIHTGQFLKNSFKYLKPGTQQLPHFGR